MDRLVDEYVKEMNQTLAAPCPHGTFKHSCKDSGCAIHDGLDTACTYGKNEKMVYGQKPVPLMEYVVKRLANP